MNHWYVEVDPHDGGPAIVTPRAADRKQAHEWAKAWCLSGDGQVTARPFYITSRHNRTYGPTYRNGRREKR